MNIINRARSLRFNQTEAEKRLWSVLRNRQFMNLKFRRQEAVDQFYADFLCYEPRLIVELDGGQHDERQKRDEERTQILKTHGFCVRRYWNNEVMQNMDGVLQDLETTVKNLMNENTLTPTLSLEGEGVNQEALK
ncbi:endonuclease domain-containing protein [Micavibrio aeruginosavorus]|uniref:endonuclease domain-containing protein n=1 Tax=Micavibrio aeruginosavorus TaxID=349221 RepID=UPI003F4ADBBD